MQTSTKYFILPPIDNITNGTTLMASTGGSSPVPVQIITSANGQQVIEQVQSISPSMLQQHHQQQHHEVQISQHQQQQGSIVYTTTVSGQESPVTQTVLVQQQQPQTSQTQTQQQVILHHQPHQPKPKTHFCQFCNKGFAAKHGLQLHNKRHPSGECTVRSHICNECNRAFFQKNHLLLHQRQHMEQQRTTQSMVQSTIEDVIGEEQNDEVQMDDNQVN